MNNKTIEQQAAEAFKKLHPSKNPLGTEWIYFGEGYIAAMKELAGHTASANEVEGWLWCPRCEHYAKVPVNAAKCPVCYSTPASSTPPEGTQKEIASTGGEVSEGQGEEDITHWQQKYISACEKAWELQHRVEELESQLSEGTAKGEELMVQRYETLISFYLGLLARIYKANELNHTLHHEVWETLQCQPMQGEIAQLSSQEAKAIAEKAWDECYLTLVSADCLHMVNLSKEDLDKEKASYLSQFSSPTENEK